MQEIYIYPAIFTYDEDGISIEFPDLPGCISCGDTDEEAVRMAKEALALYLYDAEESEETIPAPTPISKIAKKDNQLIVPIEIWMPYHRSQIKTAYVKKTLTIPNYLDALAKLNNINFSQLLQDAIKEKLSIK